MSTYNDNLRTTVKTTLADIGAEEQKRDSTLTVAHYNLYYAVGTQIRAEDMRNNANDHYDQTWCINHQGVNCSNRANNLLTTTTNANENITATVTNTATAATNVQVAANAVLKVAAGIGSANNMVNASDYDTDIQRMTGYANEVMGKTAYQAELTSQISMQASADTAQIIAKQVLDEATTTKTWFDNMLSRTDAELKNLTNTRIVDANALIAANTDQRDKEGEVAVAKGDYNAVQGCYKSASDTLNYDLQVNTNQVTSKGHIGVVPTFNAEKTSLFDINLYFEKFVPPFPLPIVPDNQQDNAASATSSSSELENEYYIAVSKADTAGLFSFDVAETTFHNFRSSRFLKVKPGAWQSIALLDKPASVDKNGNPVERILAKLKWDIDGKPIEAGTAYVTFIYIALDSQYKKAINNFNDQMSAASASFTLAETLKEIQALPDKPAAKTSTNSTVNSSTENSDDISKYTFQFEIKQATGNPDVQYRGIMVPVHSLCADDNGSSACNAQPSVKLWFDLIIAKQVAEANYQVANAVTKVDPSTKKTEIIKDTFEFSVSKLNPDNFGQLLEDGKQYIPMVLSIVLPTAKNSKGESISANYLPCLSEMNVFSMDNKPPTANLPVTAPVEESTPATAIDASTIEPGTDEIEKSKNANKGSKNKTSDK